MSTSPATSTSPQGLPTSGVWEVVPDHSSVSFRLIHHAISRFRCGFGEFQARFDADADVFTGSVAVESVRTFALLQQRLFAEDFFDVARYPEMRFASTAIERSANQIAVEGDLTIKGVTRPVRAAGVALGTAPVPHFPTHTTHEHFGLDLELTIDRNEYGLTYNDALPNGMLNLGSHVTINLELEFAAVEPIA